MCASMSVLCDVSVCACVAVSLVLSSLLSCLLLMPACGPLLSSITARLLSPIKPRHRSWICARVKSSQKTRFCNCHQRHYACRHEDTQIAPIIVARLLNLLRVCVCVCVWIVCRFRSGIGHKTAKEAFPELFDPIITATPVAVTAHSVKPVAASTMTPSLSSSTVTQATTGQSFVCNTRVSMSFTISPRKDVVLDDESMIDICFYSAADQSDGPVFRVAARRVHFPDGDSSDTSTSLSAVNATVTAPSPMLLEAAAAVSPALSAEWKPVGLKNPGSWCYLTTLVQLLAYSPVFIDGLRDYNGASPCVLALRELALSLHQRPAAVPLCDAFFASCASWWTTTTPRRQQDLQEFFHVLMGHIKEDCATSSMVVSCEWSTSIIRSCSFCDSSWSIETASSCSLVLPITPAAPSSSLCCMSVGDALGHFLAAKDCAANVRCSHCNRSGHCSQRQTISKKAKLLHIYFDRVQWNEHSKTVHKAVGDVDVEDALFVSNDWYSLYAIILHTGEDHDHGHFSLLLRLKPQVTVSICLAIFTEIMHVYSLMRVSCCVCEYRNGWN